MLWSVVRGCVVRAGLRTTGDDRRDPVDRRSLRALVPTAAAMPRG
ncbi:hypothetical protein [Rhodococcus sp. 15-649-2-2]|nr:hypothetical protein [Rhodococcus sp. 15-649-2-2]